jgi:MGT family glycosyltransferase
MTNVVATRHDDGAVRTKLDLVVVVREGGGTTNAELLAAARLAERGHRVRVLGPRDVAEPAAATGLPFHLLSDAPRVAAGTLLPRLVAATEPWTHEIAELLDAGTDAVVADSLVFAGSIAAAARGAVSCALVPTVLPRVGAGPLRGSSYASRPEWGDGSVRTINGVRTAFGLREVGSLGEQIFSADRVLVMTSRAFELPDLQVPPNVRYVGPHLPDGGEAWQPPWSPGSRPLVVVTLGTTDQGQGPVLARVHEAVRELAVGAVVTTGTAIDPSALAPSPNAVVERHVPLAAVVPHAAAVVTHGGHGSVLTALRCGVPVVCVPLGRDQPDVVARVEHHGVGVGLPADAGAAAFREAIQRVLDGPFGERARALARDMAAEPRDRLALEVEHAAGPRSPRYRDGVG